MFDYSKLRGLLRERGLTQKELVDALGISSVTVSYKLNGLREWTQDEIIKTAKLLSIKVQDIPVYFFTLKVQEPEH